MIVIVDERELVQQGYNSLFDREGVATASFGSSEFGEWVSSAADEESPEPCGTSPANSRGRSRTGSHGILRGRA